MYLIGVILFFAVFVLLSLFNGQALMLVDVTSLVVIVALSFPMLMASGLLSDFFKGFKVMGQKVNYFSKIDLERILEANKLAVTAFLLSGAIGAILGTIGLLANLGDLSQIGPNLAMAILTVLYSIILIALVSPIKAKVRTILKTME